MEVSCIILAGGKFKRIGKFKPLLILNEKPLISYVLNVARKFFSDIVIVVKNKEQKERLEQKIKKIKIVEDKSKILSPLAGIKEGIKHIKNKYVFVVACDMPFLNEKTIRDMLPRTKENADCIAYWHSLKKFEPLCTIYKKKIFEKINPRRGLQNLIRRTKNKILIPVSRETLVFFNINTQKDLNYARRLIRKGVKKFLYK
jgi:molybdopterin-guanine dinucleotide biosynthesis protein A